MRVQLTDPQARVDVGRYAARVRALDPDASIRMQAHGTVLALWACVLPGTGLFGEGVALGLRTLALAQPAQFDETVPAAALADRGVRAELGAAVPIPPTRTHPQWTALTPPRQGWQHVGSVSADRLVGAATAGIAELASSERSQRARVWEQPVPGLDPSVGRLPAAAGFAAYALGFLLPESQAQVFRHGPWTRLTAAGGHVLMR